MCVRTRRNENSKRVLIINSTWKVFMPNKIEQYVADSGVFDCWGIHADLPPHIDVKYQIRFLNRKLKEEKWRSTTNNGTPIYLLGKVRSEIIQNLLNILRFQKKVRAVQHAGFKYHEEFYFPKWLETIEKHTIRVLVLRRRLRDMEKLASKAPRSSSVMKSLSNLHKKKLFYN